jgi:hypothetical protein
MLFSKKALNFLAVYETLLTQPKLPFVSLLKLAGRRCHDKCIPRVSLHNYSGLAGNVQSLLNACSHNHASFWSPNELFKPIYNSLNFPNASMGFEKVAATTSKGKRKGRHRQLDSSG